MTGPGCSKTKSGKHRKHTPIVSEKQRRLFAAAAGGKATKAKGLSQAKAKEHLKEAKGKKLPESKNWAQKLKSKVKKELKRSK